MDWNTKIASQIFLPFKFLKEIHLFLSYVYEFLAYLYTCELHVCLQMPEEGTRCPGTGVVDGYEVLRRC